MDSEHGSGSNSKDSTIDSGHVLSFASLSPLDGTEQGIGNSSHSITVPETTESENFVSPSSRLKSFSFDFPSPTGYTSEDFIQIDPKVKFDPRASDTTIHGNVHILARYDKNGVSSDHCPKSEHDGGWNSCENSQASDLTHESLTSLTESPPIQVMERPAGFEPDRIPSSVFAVKSPTTPAEWSAASTDSLFSIHIGNNSIATDNLMLSGEVHRYPELHKPGDSPVPDELLKSGEHCSFYKSPGWIACSAPPLDILGRGTDRTNVALGKTEVEADKAIMDSPMKTANAQQLPSNIHSDRNGAYVKPIVIPKKKHPCPLCHCSNFSCGFSRSTWPSCCRWQSWRCCKFSCCCRWPSCSCCKLPSCSCCKWPSCSCFKWRSCSCCKWPSCSCCKWPSCSCFKWRSCSCCKWPSCSCCKWPSCSCFKWRSCSCCKWPSCSYCSCRCIFSCDWNCSRRTFCCS